MNFPATATLYKTVLLALSVSLPFAAESAESGFTEIFNGKDLSGWEGNGAFWSIRDGAITGQTTADKPAKQNTFLIWQDGKPDNFELRLSFRLTGQNDTGFGNSGIQYRSKVLDPERFVVGGYQADIDLSGQYIGMLYEENGRGIVMQPGEIIKLTAGKSKEDTKSAIESLGVVTAKSEIRSAYDVGEWNEFVIKAEGSRLRHFLNGTLTADVTDEDPELASASGVIALQLHTGAPMTIQFKDIRIKSLP